MAIYTTEQALPPVAGMGWGVSEEVRDCYRSLLQCLFTSTADPAPGICTLGITSCHNGEGVSTIAAQLAVTAASWSDRQVLLVDANLSRPSLHKLFKANAGPGLVEVLLHTEQPLAVLQPSPVEKLSFLSAGYAQGKLAQACTAENLGDVVCELKREHGLVLFDLPPVAEVSFAIQLAAILDGVLLVVEAERTHCEVVQRQKEVLTRARVHLIGAVLNKRGQHIPEWLYRFL